MADIALSSQATTSTVTGAYYYIIIPDGASPTGFTSYRISDTDLKAAQQTQIDDNETDIIDHEDRIDDLETNNEKVLVKAQTSSFTFSQGKDHHIDYVCFRTVSGSPVVAIGTTPGGVDILSSRAIDSSGYRALDSVVLPTTTTRTIYITISAGSVDVVRYTRKNVFDY